MYSWNKSTHWMRVGPGPLRILLPAPPPGGSPGLGPYPPLHLTTTVSVEKSSTGQPKITWNEEAGYKYLLQWSPNCSSWFDLGTTRAPTTTADFIHTDTTIPVPVKRFYRVKRTYP